MNRALHAFLLIFVFLFAQAGLAAHAAGHAAAQTHSNEQGLPSDASCELCVGYAQFGNGAPLPEAPALPVCFARQVTPDSITTLFVASTGFHSRARAPPDFS